MVKRPFLLAGAVGVIALAAGAVVNLPLAGLQFTCPTGFTRPILAFELMASPAEFITFFGTKNAPDLPEKVLRMTEALQRDNYFVPLYTLFIGLFAFVISSLHGRRPNWRLVALAPVIGVLDFFENGQQLFLVGTLAPGAQAAVEQDFLKLLWFAWPKWILIAVFFLSLRRFFQSGIFIGRMLAAASLLALPLCLSGYAGWNQGVEWYVLLMLFGMFPLTLVFCFVFQNPPVPAKIPLSGSSSVSPVSG